MGNLIEPALLRYDLGNDSIAAASKPKIVRQCSHSSEHGCLEFMVGMDGWLICVDINTYRQEHIAQTLSYETFLRRNSCVRFSLLLMFSYQM